MKLHETGYAEDDQDEDNQNELGDEEPNYCTWRWSKFVLYTY